MNIVGKHIKRIREEKGISQEELAEHLNVSRQAVSNWERGKTEPDIETLQKIATFFNVNIEVLIYGKEKESVMTYNVSETSKTVTKAGISFGTCLAVVISYVTWKSVGWAILHGMLGWIYVIYFLIKY